MLMMLAQVSYASYNVTHLNTTVVLNSTGAAEVTEILKVAVSGAMALAAVAHIPSYNRFY